MSNATNPRTNPHLASNVCLCTVLSHTVVNGKHHWIDTDPNPECFHCGGSGVLATKGEGLMWRRIKGEIEAQIVAKHGYFDLDHAQGMLGVVKAEWDRRNKGYAGISRTGKHLDRAENLRRRR